MSFLAELRRRNVIRVAGLYVVTAWLLIQIAETLLPIFGTPDWVLRALVVLLALGFIPALIVSWVFELTPEGLKRDSEVNPAIESSAATARKLDVVVIVLLLLAMGLFLGERFLFGHGVEAVTQARTDPGEPSQGGPVAIAVLPFGNMSTDAENEFFADGIAEEILNLLAGVQDLEVASRTSAFAFKGKDASVPEIAASLNVRYVLEGSVRKAGQQVRITAQLIDAHSDRHLWSETFDRRLDDIFAVQDEIAAAIGNALQVKLLGAGGEAVTAEAIQPEIYEDFLEARILMRRRSEASLQRAEALLEEVVKAEPQFARGLALLAENLMLGRPTDTYDPDEVEPRYQRAEALALRALTLNPRLASAEMILGQVAVWMKGDAAAAHAHYRRAMALEPDEPRPHHWLGIELSKAGYLDQGMEAIDTAIRLEPENANTFGWRSTIWIAMDNVDRAVADAQEQVRRGNTYGYLQVGIYHLFAGEIDAAKRLVEKDVDHSQRNAAFLDDALAARADPALRSTLLQRWELGTERTPWMSLALLALDQTDVYLDALVESGARVRWRGDGHAMVWNPRYRAMRADPRFIEIMAQRGRTELWRQLGPPPDCRAKGESFECGLGP
ncbi:tetratricopeptide repeat protein [Pseudomarimonas salicorniae]|uniref:TolB amino-terminal domain-containing protein n=1 Tax=Pseudomarimonas salicorniae TaxID=2933270 RepID=A0ABT0GDV4_9GAMM|nr:hypothetical protein [Lysobacter sp. CAU 1642]MCK7592728.1 hypothetical protein [Lysobacter sp. CAU 1642]